MPHITDVVVFTPAIVQGSPGTHDYDVKVSATVAFSSKEQELGLSYNLIIALYEIDETMDVYSAFHNGNEVFLQRASRGDKDDFLGFSPNFSAQAIEGDKTIEHVFSVRASFEADQHMELKALVSCVPETATAMKWSSTNRVQVING